MKAIVNTGPNLLEMKDWPMPQPGAGQVRIRAGACAICATDLAMIAGWDRTSFPAIPGHEWSGTVEAAGEGVDASLVGRKCVAENVLAAGGEVGFEHGGGYGQFLITDAANVHVLPDDFDLIAAALVEPTAVCVRGLNRMRADAADPTLIMGDGPIGLICTALLAAKGRRDITVLGGREKRLALARELGAGLTINYHSLGADLTGGIDEACGGTRFATVLEASGSPAAMDAAIELSATMGRVLVIGDYGQARSSYLWNIVLYKELEIIGSNASAGAWGEAVSLAVSGALPLRKLVTHVLPPERFADGIEMMRRGGGDVIKIVLAWG